MAEVMGCHLRDGVIKTGTCVLHSQNSPSFHSICLMKQKQPYCELPYGKVHMARSPRVPSRQEPAIN